jgi:predicted ATPase
LRGEQAWLLGMTGEVERALESVEQMLAHCAARDERWYMPELLRIEGELLAARRDAAETARIEALFLESLEQARGQGALFWELRTGISLAKLLRDNGRRSEVGSLLRPIYARLTEGHATADPRSVQALLEELA